MSLDPVFLQSFSNLHMEIWVFEGTMLACVMISIVYLEAWTPLRREFPIF